MTKPAMIEDTISISETNPNAALLVKVLTESKTAHVRQAFETAFQVRLESRYVQEDDQVVLLPFHTFEGNTEKVKAGFQAILDIVKDTNNTFITTHTVRDAAKRVLGTSAPQNDNRKISNHDKIKAATASFNKNAPQKPSYKSKPKNNNFKGGKPSGGGRNRDKFNKGFDTPNPNELLRDLKNSYNYKFDAKSEGQKTLFKQIDENHVTFAIGPAGTGKTHIAIAKAVEALVKGDVDKIILSRPIIQNGKDMGALPGGIREKLGPFMIPLYDELNEVIKNPELIDQMIESGIIEIGPLETARGRTFKGAYVVLDEAQNATLEQTKMFLTRFGPGTKMVLAGDPKQCDLPETQISGLGPYSDSLKKTAGIGHTQFKDKDIFRHEIVLKILQVTESDPNIQALARKERKNTPPSPGNN